MHLAIYNFGLPKESFEAKSFEGFELREPLNFEAAEKAEGFVARSHYDDDDPAIWGEQVFPRFIKGTGFDRGLSSLSIWRDIESLMAFTYSGVHANALKHHRNWTREQKWPSLVLWWVPADSFPKWGEAVERFEHLHDHGASAFAFTFKQLFDAEGKPTTIDRPRVRAIAEANAKGQEDLLAAVNAMNI